MLSYRGNRVLGILRECHGIWERRSPLSPSQVTKLLQNVPQSKVVVQPCTRRIFSNDEYRSAGAEIKEDLSDANIILGVKSPPKDNLLPEKSYMFFSHTIKAQPGSMPLLDTILEKKICLFDYECITQAGRDDAPRLVAFGKYAGRAGMIDGLQGLGLRLLAEGYSTPFLHVPATFMHQSLADAVSAVKEVGSLISSHGLPSALSPIVFAFTGNGNVAQGAREIFEYLPHKYISVEELPLLFAQHKQQAALGQPIEQQKVIYGVICSPKDMVSHLHSSAAFDKGDYYRNPHLYRNIFPQTVLPYATMLINGIYWDARYPRLVSKQDLKALRGPKGGHNQQLRVIADITCDLDGSVEMLTRHTSIEQPYYTYIPETDEIVSSSANKDGVLILGVDNLPTELPRDASMHFGEALLPIITPLLTSQGGNDSESLLAALPKEASRACIASHGALTPKWKYIARLREQTSVLTNTSSSSTQPIPATAADTIAVDQYMEQMAASSKVAAVGKAMIRVELNGHLFDTGLITSVFDTLELYHHPVQQGQQQPVNFSILHCEVRPNTSHGAQRSTVVIQLSSEDRASVAMVAQEVCQLVKDHPSAEGSARILRGSGDASTAVVAADGDAADAASLVSSSRPKRILLFGAGRVALPLIKLFREKNQQQQPHSQQQQQPVHLTIASEDASQAQLLMDAMNYGQGQPGQAAQQYSAGRGSSYMDGAEHGSANFISYRYPQDNHKLSAMIKASDIVVSLLPATMHVSIAKEAIAHGRHMVTASYVSPEMKSLHEAAKAAGVIILNEVGLDPGMDHMMIQQAIDCIHAQGGKVTELVSLCGGLPDPVAAENPLRYKMSWSPKGVLSAAGNAAQYLSNDQVISVAGEKLLTSAQPSQRFPTLRLEVLPNRDSLLYKELYQVPHVHTLCRGTLRYEGWSNVMYALKRLGLFQPQLAGSNKTVAAVADMSVLDVLKHTLPAANTSYAVIRSYLEEINNPPIKDVDQAMEAITWLGLHAEADLSAAMLAHHARGATPLDAVCSLLEKRLQYAPGEKDMVAMFHKIVGHLPDGQEEVHTSRLLAFGVPGGDSAMSMTVGYTTAAAVELILEDGLANTNIKGVVIPTDRRIYEPILKRIQDFGITWTDTKTVGKPAAAASGGSGGLPKSATK